MVTAVLRAPSLWAFVVKATVDHPDRASDAGADRIFLSRSLDEGSFAALGRRWHSIHSAALSPTGERIAVRSGTKQRILEVIDVASARIAAAGMSEFGGSGSELAWTPDGGSLMLVERKGFSFRDAADLREIGWLPTTRPLARAGGVA
jgi:hypothetical protein